MSFSNFEGCFQKYPATLPEMPAISSNPYTLADTGQMLKDLGDKKKYFEENLRKVEDMIERVNIIRQNEKTKPVLCEDLVTLDGKRVCNFGDGCKKDGCPFSHALAIQVCQGNRGGICTYSKSFCGKLHAAKTKLEGKSGVFLTTSGELVVQHPNGKIVPYNRRQATKKDECEDSGELAPDTPSVSFDTVSSTVKLDDGEVWADHVPV